jgi:hypothetical protein
MSERDPESSKGRGDRVVGSNLPQLQNAGADGKAPVGHFLRETGRSARAGDNGRAAYEGPAALLGPQQAPLLHVAQRVTHRDPTDAEHLAPSSGSRSSRTKMPSCKPRLRTWAALTREWAGAGGSRCHKSRTKVFRRGLSLRCGARTRSGSPCQSPAMPNGRCRMHGGRRRARRRVIGMRSSTDATPQRRLPDGEISALCAPYETRPARPRTRHKL